MSARSESAQAWFERELSDLHARELDLREQGEPWTSSTRLRAHTRSLHELLRRCAPTRADLAGTLVDVARLSARALRVGRTAVWLFDPSRESLRCVVELRNFAPVPVPSGSVLSSADCPRYIEALRQESVVAVSAARSDARTAELASYLEQHDVGALLDVPIVVPGDVLGVLCHEHVGASREWEPDEIHFASCVGSLIALGLETERRLIAQRAAEGMEAKYKQLVDSLPVTVYAFDYRTNRLDYVSPQGLELGEFSSMRDLLEKGVDAWIERIHPDDRQRVAERVKQGGPSAGLHSEVTYRICLPSGKVRCLRDMGRVVRRADGTPISVQGVLWDVTEQIESEASRREFERRYRTLLESVDMVAASLDAQGRTTFVNDAFVRLSGYSREELIGADWFERMVPARERQAVRERFLADVARGSVVPRFELEIETRAGKRRQLLCANTILRDADGNVQGSTSLALDITERRALDDAMVEQTKLESLGRLAAGVAHDFNNLLTVVLGQTSLLKERLGAEHTPSFDAIEQALEQAAQLTNALLAYGRRQPRKLASLALDALITDSKSLLEAMIPRQLRLTTSLSAPGASVRCDRSELRQVLINLVGNAADALGEDRGTVRIGSQVARLSDREARRKGLLAGGDYAVLTVSDDGPGMEPAVMKRIFEPFFTTKGEGRGTGLGLAIAHSVVSAAGGAIDVESAPGRGSTFRIFLPVQLAPRQSVAPVSAGAPLLVVESDGAVRDLLCSQLAGAGYDVLPAADIKTATRLITSSAVGMLITSDTLSDGSGVALARSLRAVRPETPVLIISDAPDLDEPFDCLTMPLDPARLLHTVAEALQPRAPAVQPD